MTVSRINLKFKMPDMLSLVTTAVYFGGGLTVSPPKRSPVVKLERVKGLR